jgi:hypothetical protein
MLFFVTNAARRFERWLIATLGRPYHALLGVGLVVEIVQHCRELPEKIDSAGVVKTVLAIVLFLALLLHQVGELSEHAEHRDRRED